MQPTAPPIDSSRRKLRRLTPERLALPATRYATAFADGKLYLSVLIHEPKRKRDIRRLLRLDPESEQWQTLHNEVVEMPSSENAPAPAETPQVATSLSVTPNPTDGAQSVEVWWQSPCGNECRKIIGDKTEQEFREEKPRHWIGFAKSGPALWALADDRAGGGRLMHASHGHWETVEPPAPGSRLSSLCAFEGSLIVSANHELRGCSLWKLAASATPTDPAWEPLISDGVHRYWQNAEVLGLVEFQNALYLVADCREESRRESLARLHQDGGFELVRFYGDGEWDLIIGTPRFTPRGLKVPLSGRGPGIEEWSPLRLDFFVAGASGMLLGGANEERFQLWGSADGDEWKPAFSDSFAAYQNVRIPTAYPATRGPILVGEATDFDGSTSLEIWIAAPPRARST
jgi:hypothetical protein